METDKRAELVISVMLAALFVYVLVEAREWNYRSALFPQVIAWAGLAAIAVLVLTRVVLKRFPVRSPAISDKIPAQARAAEEPAESDEPARAFRLLLWIVLVVGLSWLFGQIVAMTLFMSVFLRWEAGLRWFTALWSGALTGGFLYVIFDHVLNVTWLDGAVYPLLGSVFG